jgi:alginate O-acetyltransferase complex protein AlgI
MIFASFEFLCLFLPAFLAIYFATPQHLRNWPILILSWSFYAWWRVDFLALLVCVTVFTYAVARLMDGADQRARHRLMIVGIAGNLAVLLYFKYANFGIATFNDLVALAGQPPLAWTNIVLPAGLSFYVLQSVSYLVDIDRGSIPISRRFIDYAAYKAMFSQLIAGPIVRYAEIAGELRTRTHSLALFGAGARRFMVGFALKVIIADTLSPMVDAIFAAPRPTAIEAWSGALGYTLQLYCDFAGYSAMAIGLALMMGFHFPENFNTPYVSRSIQEFWQRWHITLSRFLRDYLYIPLGGNRRGAARTYGNLLATMAIGGFWHGASWNFLVWGLWHGGLLAITRALPGRAPPAWLGMTMTFLAVLIGWVVFRAPDLAAAGAIYAGMAFRHGILLSDDLAWQITPDQWGMLAIGMAIMALPLLRLHWPPVLTAMAPFAGFLLAITLLYSRAAVPFLYFQF